MGPTITGQDASGNCYSVVKHVSHGKLALCGPLELLPLIRLPASQAIVSLGGVNQPIRAESLEAEQTTRVAPVAVPAYVQRATSGLLSQQVLRQDGISGVCAAVFGEGDEGKLVLCLCNRELTGISVAPLVKLERVARVLSAVPSHMNREVRLPQPNMTKLLKF